MSAEQRDPAAGNDCVEMEGRGEMIKAPIDLQDLRRRLYVKAKAEPSWRFWGIYVHVCKMETLREAYALAKANNGAPGIDGVTFEVIEARGTESFLEQIRDELIQRTYRPMKARQREIPKDGGKVRVLSIPAIRDRVVQGALKLLMEPIFEADFQPGSYGYRPKRTAHDAIRLVAKSIVREKTRIIDLDLRAYFDSVRHDLLLAKVAQRVSDAEVLHLLKLMLKSTGKLGVPQGGVITPWTQKRTSTLSAGSPGGGASRWLTLDVKSIILMSHGAIHASAKGAKVERGLSTTLTGDERGGGGRDAGARARDLTASRISVSRRSRSARAASRGRRASPSRHLQDLCRRHPRVARVCRRERLDVERGRNTRRHGVPGACAQTWLRGCASAVSVSSTPSIASSPSSSNRSTSFWSPTMCG